MSTTVSNDVPEPVACVRDLMAGYGARWSLCGGWAVDAWLGKETREHGDVDVSVFVDDQRRLFAHLPGWQLLAHGPGWDANENEVWWDGRRSLPAATHIHARPPEFSGPLPKGGIAREEDGFTMEFFIDGLSGSDWVLHREPPVRVAVDGGVRPSPWGVPATAPEVLLFFKSREMRLRDRLDFAALLPALAGEQRAWLRDALAAAGHPWLAQLPA